MLSAVASLPPKATTQAGSRHRILVVDDNEDGADTLAMLLRLLGHDARATYSGRDALAIIPEFQPSLVLLDIRMPSMDGYETARRIRANPWGTDVVLIALTGWVPADPEKHTRAGFDFHLKKPLDAEELKAIIGSLRA